ncbi:limonene-1,2-epoxide hydrolase family protein [Tsukamurella sp. 1534]|uniref:limonene-1,2-epoxide hydrolase family protein n=1 Tax=Tsukamurella sp. 1534 TaxID=1151061 RepID=UPI0002EDC08B|nr:limonene-1,2-epoxide hydrolase family protein [Tsukamurella sp. 1534]
MNNSPLWSPQDVAERFVDALGSGDYEIAEQLLAKDVVYTRTSWRTLRGRRAVARHFRRYERSRVELQSVLLSAVGADGIALTERVTALVYGPLRVQFWVCARFEVRGGRIVAWRDYFDFVDVAKAVARAMAGAVYAPARPHLPRTAV